MLGTVLTFKQITQFKMLCKGTKDGGDKQEWRIERTARFKKKENGCTMSSNENSHLSCDQLVGFRMHPGKGEFWEGI